MSPALRYNITLAATLISRDIFSSCFFLTALFNHIFLFLLNFSTGHPDMQPEMLFPSPLSFLIM